MVRSETAWTAEHSRHFSEYDKSLRGHVRYEVVRHNLENVLGEFLSTSRRVIDIGGGKGEDAKWIAKGGAGHEVFVFEPDRESRVQAVKGNNGLIQIIDGDADTALSPSYFGPDSFDLVLSHGVLMYQADPGAELAKLVRLTKQGGHLSILNAGMFGKLNRLQAQADREPDQDQKKRDYPVNRPVTF